MRLFNWIFFIGVVFIAGQSNAEQFTLEQDGKNLIIVCSDARHVEPVIREVKNFHKSIKKKGSVINKRANLQGVLVPSPRPGTIKFENFFKSGQYIDVEIIKDLKARLEAIFPRRSSSASIHVAIGELLRNPYTKDGEGNGNLCAIELAMKLLSISAKIDGSDQVSPRSQEEDDEL